MKIAVITTDGGAGKTAISFALAKDLDYYYMTNDKSIVNLVYKDYSKIAPAKELPIIDNCIYDFGGYYDTGVINIIKKCDVVIVPSINDLNSKMKAISTIDELKKYNNNFLVIATRVENDTDFKEINEAIKKRFDNIKVMRLRKTKMLKNGLESGLSPLELVSQSKLMAHIGRAFIPEYKAILNYIKEVKNEIKHWRCYQQHW